MARRRGAKGRWMMVMMVDRNTVEAVQALKDSLDLITNSLLKLHNEYQSLQTSTANVIYNLTDRRLENYTKSIVSISTPLKDLRLSIDDERQRLVSGIAIYDGIDLHGDSISVSKILPFMTEYMEHGIILKNHTSEVVGRCLSWRPAEIVFGDKEEEKERRRALLVTAKIFNFPYVDSTWADIVSNKLYGFSMHFIQDANKAIKGISEISITDSPAIPHAFILSKEVR